MAALCVAALAGCASQSAREEASTVATRFLTAAANGDGAAACRLLTPKTRENLTVADDAPCAEALPVDRLTGTVVAADTWSDRAKVDADGGSLFLTEFESGWLVSSAGCRANADAPYDCVVGG